MNTTLNQQLSSWRYLWLIALIGLPALGWYGILDDFSSRDINASISSAGLIYGTARGINALVSLLQGTELSFPLLTFSIGEILDPVNDLIERFSDIVFLAMGSLALQKILLAVVSATIFNIVLSVVAVFTGLALLLGNAHLLSVLLRTFLLIAFFRFSLSLVVLANHWVDTNFLDEADQQRHASMEAFKQELRNVDSIAQDKRDHAVGVAEIQQAITANELSYRNNKLVLDQIDARISTDTEKLGKLIDKARVWCTEWDVIQVCPTEVQQAKTALDDKKGKRSALSDALDDLQDELEDQREELDCIEKRARGEDCNLWDKLPDAPDIQLMRQKLNDVNASMSEFSENTINLLVSLLLKTIGIPLLFIYLLLKIVRMNWARI